MYKQRVAATLNEHTCKDIVEQTKLYDDVMHTGVAV